MTDESDATRGTRRDGPATAGADDPRALAERVRRLEEENRRLRAELAIAPTSRGDAPRPSLWPFVALGTGIACLVAGVLIAVTAATDDRARGGAPAVAEADAEADAEDGGGALAVGDALAGEEGDGASGDDAGDGASGDDDCDPPYWFDGRGFKHYRVECLEE
jgi:hypothetical protein